MAYTFIFMRNSQTNKPPISVSIKKRWFWCVFVFLSALLISAFIYYNRVVIPEGLSSKVEKLNLQNQHLVTQNKLISEKNDELIIENGSLLQNLEGEQVKLAELQVQADIVQKIRKESFEEIEKYRSKMLKQKKQLDFYNELMSPAVKQKLQCFNMNVTPSRNKKYINYGINFMLDKKVSDSKHFSVEFRLLTGSNNVELTEKLPEDLAPDLIRKISIKNSIRLTGKVKRNNKLKGLKVLDIRVFDKSKDLVAQCWKVF